MSLKEIIRTLNKELDKITLKELATNNQIQEELIAIKIIIEDFFKMLSPKAKRLNLT